MAHAALRTMPNVTVRQVGDVWLVDLPTGLRVAHSVGEAICCVRGHAPGSAIDWRLTHPGRITGGERRSRLTGSGRNSGRRFSAARIVPTPARWRSRAGVTSEGERMNATDRPRCEFPVRWRERADGFGSVAVTCRQLVGVRRWVDVSGREHAACPRHIAQRQHRYPELADGLAEAKRRGVV